LLFPKAELKPSGETYVYYDECARTVAVKAEIMKTRQQITTSRVNKDNLQKKNDRFLSILWYSFGLASRLLLIVVPTVRLLELLDRTTPAKSPAAVITEGIIAIITILIGVWFNFTYLIEPNKTLPLIPETERLRSAKQFYRMALSFNFALVVTKLLHEVGQVVILRSRSFNLPVFDIIFNVIITVLWIGVFGWDFHRTTNKKQEETFQLKQLSLAGTASTKLRKHLSGSEIKTFEDLMFQEHEFSKVHVLNLFKLLWVSVVLAFILNLIQEVADRVVGLLI